jgi:hypothetical protein
MKTSRSQTEISSLAQGIAALRAKINVKITAGSNFKSSRSSPARPSGAVAREEH